MVSENYIVGYCPKGAFLQDLNVRDLGAAGPNGSVFYICRPGKLKPTFAKLPSDNNFVLGVGSITMAEVRELAEAKASKAQIMRVYELHSVNLDHIGFDFSVTKAVF